MFSRLYALTNVIKLVQRQQPGILSGIRTIYSQSMMGIDSFANVRQHTIEQTRDNAERFRTKMQEFADPSSPNLVFTEDLKMMCYIVNNEKDDLELLQKMIKKFHNQNKELRFGTFSFGPVVMRLYTLFNLPREALKMFNDPETNGFFDQITSFVLLADLLLKNEMYEEVVDVFEKIKEKQIQSARFPKNLVTVVFAALHKLNTPESYKKCLDLLKELRDAGHQPVRRGVCFAASLALKQNDPHIALELLAQMNRQGYVTIRNLKAEALAVLGRPDDALPILRSVMEIDTSGKEGNTSFFPSVIQKVEEAVIKMDKKEITLEFNRIKQVLEEQGGIINKEIDDFLYSEISVPTSFLSSDKQYFEASYNTRNARPGAKGYPNRRNQTFQRPGLRDLV